MAHITVERRSLDLEKWARLVFGKIDQCVIAERYPIEGWEVRNGQYLIDKYLWEDEDFNPINEGDIWGGPDITSVFRCSFIIPDCLEGKEVWFYMLTSAEVLVSEKGKYLDGVDPNRSWFKFQNNAKIGEEHSIFLEAYTRSKPDDDRSVRTRQMKGCLQHFKSPELIVIDHEMLSLKYDLDIIYQSAYGAHMDSEVKAYLQYHVGELVKLFPVYECSVDEIKAKTPEIKNYISQKIYNNNHPFGKTGRLACVAHSHLDIAYHWKVDQTVQKNARTTLIQLRLMDRYPEFKYAHTQSWTYETLEKYYPQLFEELKGKIAAGKWEVVGGMYVEPDCNLISAESLVRQILYGKQYFKEKFNIEVDNCWLPDVFGNSPIMPQILKLGGIDYFVSNKMSTWNDTNVFPHNNFIWRGLDGSEVFACVPPVHFITWMEPGQAVENWARYQEKEICTESLQMYGYGDGGSGVTDEMLEYFKRQQKIPGIPEMRITTGREYLHSAFEQTDSFPIWDGDLYLEMHRGTFTTKAELKRLNRKAEFVAQETETIMAIASLAGFTGYPSQRQLKSPWKKLLLNQFHDILPGSHTAPVTEDAIETYRLMKKEFDDLKKEAVACFTTEGEEQDCITINALSDRRGKTAYIFNNLIRNAQSLTDKNGKFYPVQKQVGPDGKERFCAAVPDVPGLSITQFRTGMCFVKQKSSGMEIGKNCMENKYFRVELDDNGCIIKILDRIRDRSVIPSGTEANEWQLFEDYPGLYNAWDIIKSYKNHKIILPPWTDVEAVEDGPVSIALRMKRAFGQSKAVQIIRMYNDRARIDFETWVDWHEDQKLLKVAFPVNVKSRVYSVDTSAGVLERMNNQNTSWEQARFEVPCHKWVDMSEGLFGVSLMNDCKYGCDVEGNVMRLSLLRAPIRPDRESDRGEHYFTYSLFTHSGCWQKDGLVEEAYDLNYPLVLEPGRKLICDKEFKALEVNNSALKCQAFKMAEDGSKDIIIRFAELYGSHGEALIKPGFEIDKAFICNILEENQDELQVYNNKISIAFRPYQIVSVKLSRKKHKK